MEDQFLKSRQEREEQRQNRSSEVSDGAAQRQQFTEESTKLTAVVESDVAAGNLEDAQLHLNELRGLILDTSNTVALPAYEMAKANTSLAHLQRSIDEARRNSSMSGSASLSLSVPPDDPNYSPDYHHHTNPITSIARKFHFTKKSKSMASASSPMVVSYDDGFKANGDASAAAAGSRGDTYGPASGTTVFVPHSKAAFVQGCTNCVVLALPTAGSVFVSGCRDCNIYVCCQQLRLKDCHNTAVYVWCASTPVIEQCDEMRFGSYEHWSGLLQSAYASGVGAPSTYITHMEWAEKVGEIADPFRLPTSYQSVNDFQWLKKTASPNWRVLAPGECREDATVFPSGPAPARRIF